MKINNESAFPSFEVDHNESVIQQRAVIYDTEKGMSLRDFFANSVMQSVLSANHGSRGATDILKDMPEKLAKMSYQMANIMLEERSKIDAKKR